MSMTTDAGPVPDPGVTLHLSMTTTQLADLLAWSEEKGKLVTDLCLETLLDAAFA